MNAIKIIIVGDIQRNEKNLISTVQDIESGLLSQIQDETKKIIVEQGGGV